jgi:hypothetical protein
MPWAAGTRAPAAVLGLVGLVLWLFGAHEVGSRASTEDQFAPLNLAVAGFVVAALGPALVFFRGRRVVGARGRAVGERAHRVAQWLAGGTETELPAGDPALLPGGDGTAFFHRPECPMGAGRGWPARSRGEHDAAGRRPCGLCRP